MRRWRQFLMLDVAERCVILWTLALLPSTVVLLRWRGLAAARAFLGRIPTFAGNDLSSTTVARMVDAAASFVGASCLPRSLVLWRLVSARGAVICLGVAGPVPEAFAAHAWVELAGRPLNDAPDVAERYAAFGAAAQGRSA